MRCTPHVHLLPLETALANPMQPLSARSGFACRAACPQRRRALGTPQALAVKEREPLAPYSTLHIGAPLLRQSAHEGACKR